MQADAGDVLSGCVMVVTLMETKKDVTDLPWALSWSVQALSILL